MGASYYRTGNHIEAIKAYSEALKLDPRDGAALSGLGIALIEVNSHEEAMSGYWKPAVHTVQLTPNSESAR